MQAARLLIVGPQGSGKGTQGARIGDLLGVPAISTGDVFRAAIKDGSELGAKVQSVIDAGDLVSDDLTFEVVRDRLQQPDAAGGFLLDGFPRNLAQVALLDGYLAERDEPLTAVIELGVARAVSIARIAERAREQGRTDDTEDAIAKRLSIYERETAPILDVYRERGLVDTIDGVGSLETVTARILGALAARGIARPAAA
ncbi:adenylate kinase [Microbacterium sp.]|uniref:adenylate kinase n=1 Tax=Microbacterium sp. TaxID=51671 RepID=UPI00092B4424|nr:adenylate kinase [Microbacterium sp.]OJU58216.1 MAG: adenylate kinase [Microbacterium sp. 70-38]